MLSKNTFHKSIHRSSLVAYQVKDLVLLLLWLGSCCSEGLIPGPGTSSCHEHAPQPKKGKSICDMIHSGQTCTQKNCHYSGIKCITAIMSECGTILFKQFCLSIYSNISAMKKALQRLRFIDAAFQSSKMLRHIICKFYTC